MVLRLVANPVLAQHLIPWAWQIPLSTSHVGINHSRYLHLVSTMTLRISCTSWGSSGAIFSRYKRATLNRDPNNVPTSYKPHIGEVDIILHPLIKYRLRRLIFPFSHFCRLQRCRFNRSLIHKPAGGIATTHHNVDVYDNGFYFSVPL